MSTNPNNAVGTNGAFGGRTSVNAFNDVLGVFKSRGIVSGWGIVPDSGMDVAVGGDGSTRDVAIAEDNIGNKTTVNNISQQPVTVSIPAAPAANSRIDLIVAYVDNPAQGVATETDNYGACGLIVVSGASAANPVAPDESAIRTAITTDGGAGSVAYYVVLGSVTVASGTTDISSNMISAGSFAAVKSDNVDYANYTTEEEQVGKWINGKNLYRRVVRTTSPSVLNSGQSLVNYFSWGVSEIVYVYGRIKIANQTAFTGGNQFYIWDRKATTFLTVQVNIDAYLNSPMDLTVYYTKVNN